MSANAGQFRLLVESMMAGSEEAAWQLTNLYSPHIMRAVRATLPQLIRTKVDSQDFLQSVWASMLLEPDRLGQFQTSEQFIRYLAVVAKNKVVDKYRHYNTKKNNIRGEVRIAALEQPSHKPQISARKEDGYLAGQDPTPSQIASVRENWRKVLDQGSPRDREIISLRMRGLAYKSIASSLNINERTVQRTVDRLLSEFQK